MITYLCGKLTEKKPPFLVVEINGIGYQCLAPMSTFYQLPETGETIKLLTHLSIREDAHTLFAFANEQERSLFRALIKVSGVGPKLALTILSGVTPDEFVRCIQAQDTSSLVHIPGIGKKTAERLVIETRDTLANWHSGGNTCNGTTVQADALLENQPLEDAIAALVSLGYKLNDAKKAVTKIHQPEHNNEQLIRLALQQMIRRR